MINGVTAQMIGEGHDLRTPTKAHISPTGVSHKCALCRYQDQGSNPRVDRFSTSV